MSQLIRKWRLEDLTSVQRIMITTWLDAYSAFIPEADLRSYHEEHYNLTALEKLYHTTGVTGYVAEVDHVLAAFIRTQLSDEDGRFYVSSLYVLPEYQGRGLGSKLMKAADECAVAHHADEVWLGVMTQNIPALNWYRKIGFTFVEEQPFTMGATTVAHLIGFRKVSQEHAVER